MPAIEARRDEAKDRQASLRNHFAARAEAMSWDLHELFRTGRASLAIGLIVLAGCMVLARAARGWLGRGPVASVFAEGLVILGWVANWRPVEILLYDWWPIIQRRRLYSWLAKARVQVIDSEPPGA